MSAKDWASQLYAYFKDTPLTLGVVVPASILAFVGGIGIVLNLSVVYVTFRAKYGLIIHR
jgi:hypothetical protein